MLARRAGPLRYRCHDPQPPLRQVERALEDRGLDLRREVEEVHDLGQASRTGRIGLERIEIGSTRLALKLLVVSVRKVLGEPAALSGTKCFQIEHTVGDSTINVLPVAEDALNSPVTQRIPLEIGV